MVKKKVIGIPLDMCFMCGTTENITRHHAIAKELHPMSNVTIPLCVEHKDIMHHIQKQMYIPKRTRQKLGRALKELNNLTLIITSLRNDFDIHKSRKRNALQSTFSPES